MATPQSGSQTKADARSMRRDATTRGLLAASACAKDALRTAAGKRGMAEARLITHWPEIAGATLADATRPVRVKPPRGLALGGVLVLAVDGARASEVEHEIPRLIERVNAHYGYGAVTEVKLTQAVSGPISMRGGPKRRPRCVRPDELPEEKKKKLDAMTTRIESDALRDALQRLGANILSREEQPKKADRAAGRGVVRSLSQRARATPPS